MKRAAAADARRRVHLRKKHDCPIFEKIKISNLNGFSEIQFTPKSSFFAICGGTGVGKSTIIDLIDTGLRPQPAGAGAKLKTRYGNPTIEIKISSSNGEFTRTVDFSKRQIEGCPGFDPECKVITMHERTEILQQIFDEINPEVAIDGLDPRVFSSADLQLVSRVIGKYYTSILCFEAEDPDNAEDIVPFFIVKEQDIKYDLRHMGTGELSAVYLIWFLNYAKKNSIILIEEPEAMMPPSGHLSLLDALCIKSIERGLSLIVATHSPEIIAALPLEKILSLRRYEGTTSYVSEGYSKGELLSSLGLRVQKVGLIAVEDDMAMIVTREMLSRFDLELTRRIEIQSIGSGFGAIRTMLESVPTFKAVKIIGLLDGDMREAASKWPCSSNCLFLPFARSMEAEFLDCIGKNLNRFSETIGRSVRHLQSGLQRARSLEPHDGFADFCEEIGVSAQTAALHAFAQWLSVSEHEKSCVDLAKNLRTKLKIS